MAETSFPSTGQGIELAWATEANTPTICLYKEGTKPSSSLKFIGLTPIKYKDFDDFLAIINSKLEQVHGVPNRYTY